MSMHLTPHVHTLCAAFVNENSHLDPILAFQKAIAVPRNHVASTFKASWQAGHDSLFNSQYNSNMFSTVGSVPTSVPTGGHSIVASAQRCAEGARSLAARTARRPRGPQRKRSHFMRVLCVVFALLALAYLAVRLWDAIDLHLTERRPGRLVYRCADRVTTEL